jgi:ligand-binding sensor domain-containing protein/serine phosphatase RsbU (regulator of sigma subunit)
MLGLGDLPSVALSMQDLVPHKVTPKIVVLQKPKKTKAGSPQVENQFTDGLMELGQDQGLAGTTVSGIAQDQEGTLWIATDNGLCAYDGESIYTYLKSSGLSRDTKNSICVDQKGHIWAAGNGVDEIIPEAGIVKHYGKKEGLTSNAIGSVMIDSKGRICLTGRQGVDFYDPQKGTCVHLGAAQGLSSDYINCMTEDHAGRFWFASNGGGVNIYDPATSKLYLLNETNGLSNNDIRALCCDREGRIWLGGWNGGIDLFDIQQNTYYQLRLKHGIAFHYIWDIIQDSKGRMWIAYQGRGADVYDPQTRKIHHVYGKEGISKSTVYALFEDKDQCIWMGCSVAGVVHYDPSNGDIRNYDNTHWAARSPIMALYEDRQHQILLSSAGAGTDVFDLPTQTLKSFYLGPEWSNAWQNYYLDNGQGQLYMGTEYCFNIWDRKKQELRAWSDKNGLVHNRIKCAILYDGGALIGTRGGVYRYDSLRQSIAYLTCTADSCKNAVECICRDQKGKFWIGTLGAGVFVYDPVASTLNHFAKEQGFSGSPIYALLADDNNCIWVATESEGLKKIDQDKHTVTNLTIDNGLSEMTVLSLLEKDHKIYAGTARGLSIIEQENGRMNISSMGKAQGLRAVDFNPNAAIVASNGNIWWGAGDMMIAYLPGKKNPVPGKTQLTAIDIMNKEQVFPGNQDLLSGIGEKDTLWSAAQDTFAFKNLALEDTGYLHKNHIHWKNTRGPHKIPVGFELPYDQDHLTFHFTGNYLSNTDKTRYRYILEGIDGKWNKIVNENFADYRNIPPGNYTFKVCSSNNGGPWSPPAVFSFTIAPPWWKTRVAYAGYIVLILALIFGYNKLRTLGLVKRQKELETVVTERTSEIVEQKKIVEEKQKEIIESINYAKRLQEAILPSLDFLRANIPDSFIYYRPKDIVAGDFYWAELQDDLFFIAAADSTGHGVPGAMVSVVCSNALNSAVKEFNLTDTGKILDKTRELVVETFRKSTNDVKDGMDISLLCLDRKNRTIRWSGANNPLWYFQGNEMKEVKADKQPVGKSVIETPFTTHHIGYEKGTTLYLLTDGFADQFGGDKGKKLKGSNLQKLLSSIQTLEMRDQQKKLDQFFTQWQGELEQVDDVCVIGIRL